MNILILRGLKHTAKSYPHWDAVVAGLLGDTVWEVRQAVPLKQVKEQMELADIWLCIDSFPQHLAKYHGLKPGIVIWGPSDPLIFGYPENTNLLKSRAYLRPDQFRWWDDVVYNPEAFVSPETVLDHINQKRKVD